MSDLTFRLLKTGDEQALIRFLNQRLESSMFLYSNMQQAGLEDKSQRFQGTYAAVFDGETILGVVAHYWNNNLILQSDIHLDTLIDLSVSSSDRPIGGLMGISEQVVKARDFLKLKHGALIRDEVQWLYSLDLGQLQVPELLKLGSVSGRRAETKDIDLLAIWRAAYLAETLGLKTTTEMRQDARRNMQNYVKSGRTWILEVGGKLVAASSFNAVVNLDERGSLVQVGGVWTPPKHRRRGYGRAVVAASLLDAKAEKAIQAILFTAEDNFPAQKAYVALGFQRIGTYRLTILNKPVPGPSLVH